MPSVFRNHSRSTSQRPQSRFPAAAFGDAVSPQTGDAFAEPPAAPLVGANRARPFPCHRRRVDDDAQRYAGRPRRGLRHDSPVEIFVRSQVVAGRANVCLRQNWQLLEIVEAANGVGTQARFEPAFAIKRDSRPRVTNDVAHGRRVAARECPRASRTASGQGLAGDSDAGFWISRPSRAGVFVGSAQQASIGPGIRSAKGHSGEGES